MTHVLPGAFRTAKTFSVDSRALGSERACRPFLWHLYIFGTAKPRQGLMGSIPRTWRIAIQQIVTRNRPVQFRAGLVSCLLKSFENSQGI